MLSLLFRMHKLHWIQSISFALSTPKLQFLYFFLKNLLKNPILLKRDRNAPQAQKYLHQNRIKNSEKKSADMLNNFTHPKDKGFKKKVVRGSCLKITAFPFMQIPTITITKNTYLK